MSGIARMASVARAHADEPVRAPGLLRGPELGPGVRLALLGLPLATGAALVVFILAGVPLGVAGIGLAVVGLGPWAYGLQSAPPAQRAWLSRRVRAGLIAGVPALVAYDGTRWGLVSIATLSFQPFHALPLFGQAILGPSTGLLTATVVGTAFHVANGLGFSVAFAIAAPRPTVLKGVAWGLFLEAAMLLLYPSWLGLSLTGELLPVSLLGHLAFGSVLGAGVRRLVK